MESLDGEVDAADDLLVVAAVDDERGEAATLEAFLAGAQGALDYVGEMGGKVSIKSVC